MFLSRNKKNNVYPCKPQFYYVKVGFNEVDIIYALLQLTNFTLGPDATPNTETHKNSVRTKAANSVNAPKRTHKNQINHYNKQRRVLMVNSAVCKSKWKSIVKPRRAKPKTYRQLTPVLLYGSWV